MTIVVIGPPAAGKSRIGKRIARILDLSYADTDSMVVAEHGPIPALFAEHGEEYFRALERSAVQTALARGGVVSVGGGAVLDPATQGDLARATVVLLTVSLESVAARIGDGKRPLVNGIDSWQALVEKRTPLYRSLADYTADTSNRPISLIAEEIADWWLAAHPAAPASCTEQTEQTEQTEEKDTNA